MRVKVRVNESESQSKGEVSVKIHKSNIEWKCEGTSESESH